jgi:hypothetical protein
MLGSSRVAAQLAASQEGLSSMSEWVNQYIYRLPLVQMLLEKQLYFPRQCSERIRLGERDSFVLYSTTNSTTQRGGYTESAAHKAKSSLYLAPRHGGVEE